MRQLFLLAACVPAWGLANDGWWSNSSTPYAFEQEHTQIQLIREHLHLDLQNGKTTVTVTFLFTNHGPATTVTMAFPETQKSLGSSLTNFRSWVDGEEVDVTYRVLQEARPGEHEDRDYKAVWLKQVSFREGQAKVVKVRYIQRNSYSTFGTQTFQYIFKTGATWQGNIEEIRVTYDSKDLYALSEPYFVQAGQTLSRVHQTPTGKATGKLLWHDIEPDFNLMVNRCPGDWNVEINGVLIDPGLFFRQPLGELGDVQVPVFELSYVFASPQPYLHRESVTWALASRKIDPDKDSLRRGVQSVESYGSKIKYVYLRDIVEALGGTYRYDAKLEKVFITVPKEPAPTSATMYWRPSFPQSDQKIYVGT